MSSADCDRQKKQVQNVEWLNYLDGIITNDARFNMKINPGFQWQKKLSKGRFFTSKSSLNLRKKLIKCCIWGIALYGAETWTLRKIGQKYKEIFEMWRWRRMEKISCTNYVRNEEVLCRVNPLKTKRRLLYLKIQFVPRSKHFSSRL